MNTIELLGLCILFNSLSIIGILFYIFITDIKPKFVNQKDSVEVKG